MRVPQDKVARARTLRRNLSPPEARLWVRLRRRDGGFIFRRQHPIGPYVLDFYCPKAKLALEVDGDTHSHPEQATRDAARDRWLNGQGVEVLRIPAIDVLRDVDGTADLIWRTAESRL